MTSRLYVDDVRPAPAGWRVARTVAEAVGLLAQGGIEEVSLDYVIGHGGETFLPVARYIAEMPPESRPRRVRLHTSSDHGALLLAHVLRGAVELIPR